MGLESTYEALSHVPSNSVFWRNHPGLGLAVAQLPGQGLLRLQGRSELERPPGLKGSLSSSAVLGGFL